MCLCGSFNRHESLIDSPIWNKPLPSPLLTLTPSTHAFLSFPFSIAFTAKVIETRRLCYWKHSPYQTRHEFKCSVCGLWRKYFHFWPGSHYAGEIWKREMFCVHTTPEKFEMQQSPVILDLCLRKTRAAKSHDYRDVIVSEKLRFRHVFRSH